MSELNIKDLVKGTVVRFVRYRAGNLYYEVIDKNFEFPVPIEDCGEATFPAEEKAMLFMRYIRKHLEVLKES